MDNTLKILREEIDRLDNEFLNLLSKRISIVKKIGEIKKIKNTKLYDKKRQLDVLNKWKKNAEKGKFPEKIAEEIYKILHDYSLKVESGKK